MSMRFKSFYPIGFIGYDGCFLGIEIEKATEYR